MKIELKRCWCGRLHAPWTWHDPTHGRIDRDIQQRVVEQFGADLPSAQKCAIEITIQNKRNRAQGRTLI